MIFAAIQIGNVVQALVLAYDLLTGAIFVPVFGAFFWTRATWQGALSSICVSGTVVLLSLWRYGFGSNLPIVYGLVASAAVYLVVSLVTDPPSEESVRQGADDLTSNTAD